MPCCLHHLSNHIDAGRTFAGPDMQRGQMNQMTLAKYQADNSKIAFKCLDVSIYCLATAKFGASLRFRSLFRIDQGRFYRFLLHSLCQARSSSYRGPLGTSTHSAFFFHFLFFFITRRRKNTRHPLIVLLRQKNNNHPAAISKTTKNAANMVHLIFPVILVSFCALCISSR